MFSFAILLLLFRIVLPLSAHFRFRLLSPFAMLIRRRFSFFALPLFLLLIIRLLRLPLSLFVTLFITIFFLRHVHYAFRLLGFRVIRRFSAAIFHTLFSEMLADAVARR